MKYIIYEIVPSVLSGTEPDGYYTKQVDRNILVELDVFHITSRHSSFEDAESEIRSNKTFLKFKRLTILPVFDIGWDGEIR